MDTLALNKLLLKTAFCCMTSDGYIDSREIVLIKSLFEHISTELNSIINQYIDEINTDSKLFITSYMNELHNTILSEDEGLSIIDIAIQTIKADEQVEYSEIKFFKNIRSRLNISNSKILEKFPDVEMFIEDDINSKSTLDRLVNQYFEGVDLPKFEIINIDLSSIIE